MAAVPGLRPKAWLKYQYPVRREGDLNAIIKSFMKNRPRTYRIGRETLPLEGGGKRVGVKGLTGVARRLRKYSTDTEQHL